MTIPLHLQGSKATGGHSFEPVAQFEIGSFKNFVYLIMDWTSRIAMIIDPQEDLSAPLGFLNANHFSLSGILLTHSHWDHIAGIPKLVKLFPKIPIFVHPGELFRLDKSIRHSTQIQTIQDQSKIAIGQLTIQVFHTPGHSQGGCCFFLNSAPSTPYLFSGDTVFIRDCGRTDLDTGSTASMFQSIQNLKILPSETFLLPGHHYASECASTLEKEKQENPAFKCKNLAELEALP